MPCGSRSDVAGGDSEIPELDERQQKAMKDLEKVAEFMDTSWITLCGYGIGADGILGLVLPEVGDCITGFISLYLMCKIWHYFPELFKKKWHVMLMNIGVDLGTGLVPILGDIVDMGWHSNIKNVNILRKYYGLELLSEIKPEDKSREAKGETELVTAKP